MYSLLFYSDYKASYSEHVKYPAVFNTHHTKATANIESEKMGVTFLTQIFHNVLIKNIRIVTSNIPVEFPMIAVFKMGGHFLQILVTNVLKQPCFIAQLCNR